MLSLSSLLATVAVTVTPPDSAHERAAPDPPAVSSPLDPRAEPERADTYLQGVLASCLAALGEGTCVPSDDQSASSRAHVNFLVDAVEATLTYEGGIVERRLDFGPADTVPQRQVAAGLLVAAMTAAVEHAKHAPVTVSIPEEPAQRPPPEVPTDTREKQSVGRHTSGSIDSFLDVAGTLEVSLDGSHLSGGGLLAGRIGLTSLVGVHLGAIGFYSSEQQLEIGAVQVMVGPSFSLLGTGSPLRWFIATAVLAHGAQIADRLGGDQSELLFRGGLRLRTSFSLRKATLSPTFGVSFSGLLPRLEVKRDGETVLNPFPVSAGAFLGTRWGAPEQ